MIFAGTVGLMINMSTGVSLQSPAELVVEVTNPDGTTQEWTPVIDDPNTGTCHHITTEGQLDQHGRYKIQGRYHKYGPAAPELFYSEHGHFRIFPK